MSIEIFKFTDKIETSETIVPGLNFSPLFDFNNGRFFIGKDDLSYCAGGLASDNAIVGGSNTQKTGMLVLAAKSFLLRYPQGIVIFGDTESTFDVGRLAEMVDAEVGEVGYFEREINKVRFYYQSANNGFDGGKIHNQIKDIYQNYLVLKKEKNKDMFLDTVFYDKEGRLIKILTPILYLVDSLTDVRFNEVSARFQEGEIDEGGKKRTRDMEFGNMKRILFEDAHYLGGMAGMRLVWVGQTTDMINMDGRPQEKQSVFIRQGKKIAKCPKAILQLPQNGYEIIKGSPLKQEQEWKYPNPLGRDVIIGADARENPDLLSYNYTLYRNKGGTSGIGGHFLGSQSEGILEGLTMYDYLKSSDYFALEGNKTTHHCTFFPELKVTRKSVWHHSKTNHKFYRALTIAYHICRMQQTWLRLPDNYRMTPADIYQAIIDRGFSWDELLDSVDYWHTNPDIDKPTITAHQILRLATGESVATGRNKKKK